MKSVFIITEANETVETGHLMECIVCAEELLNKNFMISFWINNNAVYELKKRIPCHYNEYFQSIEHDYLQLLSEINRRHPEIVLFNLREVKELFLENFRKQIENNVEIICIDEFGHRNLPADIIINPMIDSYYWNYNQFRGQLFCGAKYLILPQKLKTLHKKTKLIRKKIETITITMGGVDPKNLTMQLMEIIPTIFPEAVINIIVCGGNCYKENIRKKGAERVELNIFENITDLPEMIQVSDLVICAGGNTLHETACLGTPAIILPSMPHEKRTAKCFEDAGFGYAVNNIEDMYNRLIDSCEKLKEYQIREEMSANGKRLSDGLGVKRVCSILSGERERLEDI